MQKESKINLTLFKKLHYDTLIELTVTVNLLFEDAALALIFSPVANTIFSVSNVNVSPAGINKSFINK